MVVVDIDIAVVVLLGSVTYHTNAVEGIFYVIVANDHITKNIPGGE